MSPLDQMKADAIEAHERQRKIWHEGTPEWTARNAPTGQRGRPEKINEFRAKQMLAKGEMQKKDIAKALGVTRGALYFFEKRMATKHGSNDT